MNRWYIVLGGQGGRSLGVKGVSGGQVVTLTALWVSLPPRPLPQGGGKGQRRCRINMDLSTWPHFTTQHGPTEWPLPDLSLPPPTCPSHHHSQLAGLLTTFQEMDPVP